MEASSILAEDEAVESGNRERVVEAFRHRADNLISKADELEQRVNEIVQFYTSKKQPNNSKGSSVIKDKDKEKSLGITDSTNIVNNSASNGGARKQVDGSRKEVVCSKRMLELMRQFGTMLKQAS